MLLQAQRRPLPRQATVLLTILAIHTLWLMLLAWPRHLELPRAPAEQVTIALLPSLPRQATPKQPRAGTSRAPQAGKAQSVPHTPGISVEKSRGEPAAPITPNASQPAPAPATPDAITVQDWSSRVQKDYLAQQKATPVKDDPHPDGFQLRLVKAIAAAGKPTEVTLEEFELPDGGHMTKVTGPNGTYRVTLDANKPDGLDVFQRGPQRKLSNCTR